MKRTSKKILSLILSAVLLFSILAIPAVAETPVKNRPVIILKMDDLGPNVISNFQTFVDCANELDVPFSFGVIGKNFDRVTGLEVFNKIRDWYSQGIEIWNHGYYHSKEEYSTNSYEQQLEDFSKTQKIFKDYCGITITTFGSPYNNSGETTQKMLAENFPEIKTVLLAKDFTNANPNAVYLSSSTTLESKTGVVIDFEGFVDKYESNNRGDHLILQGHPAAWSVESYDNFKKIVNYLKEDGCKFMTPSEFTTGALAALKDPSITKKSLEVRLDKKFLDFDVSPRIINGRTMVPFRTIFEALGAEVSFDEQTNTATGKKGDKEIKITNGKTTALINGTEIETDVAPTIIDGRFLVPVRFISESFGCYVYWHEETYSVVILSSTTQQNLDDGAYKIHDVAFNDYQYVADELGILSCDGDENTVWSAQGFEKWLCYDLGEIKPLKKASIMWNNGDKRKAYFKVYLSNNGQTFEKVFDGETSGTNAGYEDVSLDGKSARYIKIECNGNSTSAWNAIKEIRFY